MARMTGVETKLNKGQAQRLLADVPQEKVFWSHDGQMFRNLKELAKGLSAMSDETYTYHTDSSKNDFANWVREVIGDKQTANDLTKALNRRDAAKLVETRISYLLR